MNYNFSHIFSYQQKYLHQRKNFSSSPYYNLLLNDDDKISSSTRTTNSFVIKNLNIKKSLKKEKQEIINKKKEIKNKKYIYLNNLFKNTMKTKASNLLNNIKNKSENNNNNFFNKTFISNQKLNLSEIKIPSKLTNKINSAVYKYKINNKINIFSKSCKNILLLKECLNEYKISVLNKEKDNNNKLNNINNTRKICYDKYNNITKNLIPKYRSYNFFLFNKKNQEFINLMNLQSYKYKLQKEVNKLQSKFNNLQQKYTIYLKCRNLLVIIKENIKNLPKEFYDFNLINLTKYKNEFFSNKNKNLKTKHRISFSYKLSKDNKKFKKKNSNNNFSSFKNDSNEIEEIEDNININRKNNFYKNEIYKYLDYHIKIFYNAEEYFNKIKKKEDKLFNLYEIYQNKYRELNLLKKEFNELYKYNNYYEKDNLYYDNKLTNELDEIKKKNIDLIKKIKILKYELEKFPNRNLNNYLKKIPKGFTINENIFLLKLKRYYISKNFKNENAYIFYYLGKVIKKIFNFDKHFFVNVTNKEIFFNDLKILDDIDNNNQNFLRQYVKTLFSVLDESLSNLINKIYLYDINVVKKLKTLKFKEKKLIEIKNKNLLKDVIKEEKIENLEKNFNKIRFIRNNKLFVDYRNKEKEKNNSNYIKLKMLNEYNSMLEY